MNAPYDTAHDSCIMVPDGPDLIVQSSSTPAPKPQRPQRADEGATVVSHALQDDAIIDIARFLLRRAYQFTTVTPDTHRIVNARPSNAVAHDLQGIFGWNRPFYPSALPDAIIDALHTAEAVDRLDGDLLRTRIRFSSVNGLILVHSSFPTDTDQSVFFGPDTYRFIELVRRVLPGGGRLLEIGAGTGAAAFCQADRYPHLELTDINPLAVRYARINAILAGCEHAVIHCADLATGLTGPYEAIIANPPYLIDPTGPVYRNGGHHGITVALRMVQAALPLLAQDGCFVLYTGAPIADGMDLLEEALAPILIPAGRPAHYDELEVDVFGSSMAGAHYDTIDRIAVVAVIIGRSDLGDPGLTFCTPASASTASISSATTPTDRSRS